MNFAYFRRVGALLTLTALVVPSGQAAETGTVSAGTVNVRGRAGFIGEVITKLNKGDKVTILDNVTISNPKTGEPADWLKIALPANTPVWLYASFIDPSTHTVNASKLKVRGGPGINFSVLGYLEKGATIKEIRRSGDWMEIEPPEGLGAYVAANLVTRQTTSPTTETAANTAQPNPAETTPAPEKTTEATSAKAETPSVATETVPEEPKVAETRTEVPKATDVVTPAPTTPPPTTESEPVATTTTTPVATPPPGSTTIVAEPAPAIATEPTNAEPNLTPEERASQALEERTRESQHWEVPIDQDDALLKNLPEHRREVVREGKIRRAMSIQAPGDYILEHVETGLRLNYLYTSSTNIPLKELLGVKVRIKGEEGIDPRWPGTPVLLIKSLEVLP